MIRVDQSQQATLERQGPGRGHWLLPLGRGQPTKLPVSHGASQRPRARGRPGGGGPTQEGSSGGTAGTQATGENKKLASSPL